MEIRPVSWSARFRSSSRRPELAEHFMQIPLEYYQSAEWLAQDAASFPPASTFGPAGSGHIGEHRVPVFDEMCRVVDLVQPEKHASIICSRAIHRATPLRVSAPTAACSPRRRPRDAGGDQAQHSEAETVQPVEAVVIVDLLVRVAAKTPFDEGPKHSQYRRCSRRSSGAGSTSSTSAQWKMASRRCSLTPSE